MNYYILNDILDSIMLKVGTKSDRLRIRIGKKIDEY